ncbi:MAG: AMP-binding protein [Atopobiaceae bacterium]|nr:AMP-binding protein [Atopobiaceae bacterium]
MLNIHQRYCIETFDAKGNLSSFRTTCGDHFNYAYDVIDEIGRVEPERMAMIWRNPEGEEHDLRFSDIARWSNKTANFFLSQGIKRGDRVMVILRRHYSFWIVSLALSKIGAVVVPATFMLKAHDISYRIEAAELTAIVTNSVGTIADEVDEAVASLGLNMPLFMINGAQPDLARSERTFIDPALSGPALSGPDGLFAAPCKREGWIDAGSGIRVASDQLGRISNRTGDPFLIYFTSGTSGEPKMALHSFDYAAAQLCTAKYWHGIDPEGVHMTVADTGWAKCTWGKFYGQWFMEGCQLVYDYDRFHGNEILELIQKYHLTTFCCPPTMWRMLSREDVDSYDFSSIKRFTTAGEALPPDQFDFWLEHTGHMIYEGFGQTESPVIVANLLGSKPRPGSMGKPVPFADIALVGPDGEACEPGEEGEICIRCDPRPAGIIVEYYRAADKTAEVFSDGWYHTGDTAYSDESGYLYYCGRNDDLIKSSGYRISPFEVESALLRHAAVRECAVTGVPDPLRGFAVKATIVLEKGYEGSPELIKELQVWAREQTAPYKYPRIVEFVDALPQTFSGKIRRAAIREQDAAKSTAA